MKQLSDDMGVPFILIIDSLVEVTFGQGSTSTTNTAIDLLVRSDLIHSLQHNFKHLSQHHSFTVVVDKLIEVFFLTSGFPFLKLLILRNMKHKQTQP